MQYPSDIAELLGPGAPSAARADVVAPLAVSAVAVRGETAYEGASSFDQLALWAPSIRSADAEILPEKPILDARVRDMTRNDAHVQGAQTLHKDNIVGAMYLLNAKPMSRVLFGKEDSVWEEEYQEEVETLFHLTAESPECWLDAQRVKTLTDIVRLAVGVDLAGGEVLASAEWMPDDGRPCRTAIQMVDTDRLSNPLNQLFRTNKIRRGVERDVRGAPVAYHIRMGHPGDYTNPDSYIWKRVMARKPWGRPQILHQFEQNRPDQSRGISGMVAALTEMKMLKGFRKVELQRAVLAATYAASIESELPTADVLRAMGGDDKSNPSIEYMREYLAAIQEYSGSAKNLTIDGAKIPVFMPGTKLNLKNPGAESPAGDKFEQSVLRYLASALNVSYEQLSRDYSQTNYSSARASRGETEKHLASRKKRVADRTANFVYRLWLEEQINANRIEALRRRNVPSFYEGLNAEAYSNCDWIGAGAGLIDPLKETQAFVLQMKNGITPREHVIAKIHGGDWRVVGRQIAREIAFDEKLGLPCVFTMAATESENALSGTPQERES